MLCLQQLLVWLHRRNSDLKTSFLTVHVFDGYLLELGEFPTSTLTISIHDFTEKSSSVFIQSMTGLYETTNNMIAYTTFIWHTNQVPVQELIRIVSSVTCTCTQSIVCPGVTVHKIIIERVQ